jgi:hypothetical protein
MLLLWISMRGLIDGDKEEYLGSEREGKIFLTDGIEDDHGGS